MNNKDAMVTLSTKEQCRSKIHVWFGSKSNHIHNCVESIINCNDEIVNNFQGGEITVSLSDDCKTMSVEDTGRGMRLGDTTNGVPNYKLYFETLFSSTNYNNIKSQKITGGTNGVANTVICQTSNSFIAESWYDGSHYVVTYNNGDICEEIVKEKCEADLHGTKITFTSSEEVYTTNVFDVEEVKSLCNKLAGISNTVRVAFKHKCEEVTYAYSNYEDYMEVIEANKLSNSIVFNEREFIEGTGERNSVKCLLSLSTDPVQQTFLNYIHLKEHGTIYDGVVDGLRKFCQKNITDKKTKLTIQDIEMSFNILCTVMSTNVEYASQMKFSTAKQLYKKLVSEYIVENMEIFKAENPKEFDKILKHLQQINSFNTKNENSIKNIKKKLSEKADTFTNRVEGLVDCRNHGENAELFICEGKSALASVVASRNATFQAAYPIRGKTLSVLKASTDQIFNNQIITDIIKLLGCGCTFKNGKKKLLDDFNISNLRYGKIIITVDADPDGSSILCLLTTTFYKLMPELLKQGKVYLAKTPLYEITTKDSKLIYAFTDKEKETICTENKVAKIQRNKGLGEVDAETMAETTMNPTTRIIEKIIINNEKDMANYFDKWMGSDVSNRKEYITQHLHEYAMDLD